MLEYALKQERSVDKALRSSFTSPFRLKFNKSKGGSETGPTEEQKPVVKTSFDDGNTPLPLSLSLSPSSSADENKDESNLNFAGSSVSFKQGRQLLRQ